MFNEYPYVNLQDVNLDWILKHIKDLKNNLQDFIKLNTIKYADPIIWNITKQYETNTVVIDGNTGTAYLSVQPVPAGVALTNTDYWTVIFTLNLTTSNQNITFRDDGTNVVATFASDTGDWLLWNFYLYRVTQPISINTAYVEGFNIERFSVELFIKDYINMLAGIIGDLDDLTTSDKTTIVDAINSLLSDLNTTIGDLDDLNTSNTDSIVDAINSLLADIATTIGDLNDLTTTNKTSIVNAINEINAKTWPIDVIYPEDYGAVGDGVEDDTAALQACINDGANKLIVLRNTYRLTTSVTLINDLFIKGSGGKIIDDTGAIATGTYVLGGSDLENVNIYNVDFVGDNESGNDTFATFNYNMLIKFTDSNNITIEKCSFIGITKGDVIQTINSNYVYVKNCNISYFIYAAIEFSDGSSYVYAIGNRITNSRFVPATQNNCYRIVLAGYTTSSYTPGHDLYAIGNYIDDDMAHMWEGIDAHGGTNIYILHNTIKNIQIGIACVGATTGTPIFQCFNVHIDHNDIEGYIGTTTYTGGNSGITYSGYGVSITNNFIMSMGCLVGASPDVKGYGGIIGTEITLNVIIANNEIRDQGGCGISLQHKNAQWHKITNNLIQTPNQIDGQTYVIYIHDNTTSNIWINENTFNSIPYMHFSSAGSGTFLNDNFYAVNPLASYLTNYANVNMDYIDSGHIGNIAVGRLGAQIKCSNPTAAGPKFWTCTGTSPVTYTATN